MNVADTKPYNADEIFVNINDHKTSTTSQRSQQGA